MADFAPITPDHSHELFLHSSDHPNCNLALQNHSLAQTMASGRGHLKFLLFGSTNWGLLMAPMLNLLLELLSLSGNVVMQWSFPGY